MSASLRSVDGQDEAAILREIQSALRDLRFGAVEITVHNAQVVQIERKEKFRLQNPGNKPSLSKSGDRPITIKNAPVGASLLAKS